MTARSSYHGAGVRKTEHQSMNDAIGTGAEADAGEPRSEDPRDALAVLCTQLEAQREVIHNSSLVAHRRIAATLANSPPETSIDVAASSSVVIEQYHKLSLALFVNLFNAMNQSFSLYFSTLGKDGRDRARFAQRSVRAAMLNSVVPRWNKNVTALAKRIAGVMEGRRSGRGVDTGGKSESTMVSAEKSTAGIRGSKRPRDAAKEHETFDGSVDAVAHERFVEASLEEDVMHLLDNYLGGGVSGLLSDFAGGENDGGWDDFTRFDEGDASSVGSAVQLQAEPSVDRRTLSPSSNTNALPSSGGGKKLTRLSLHGLHCSVQGSCGEGPGRSDGTPASSSHWRHEAVDAAKKRKGSRLEESRGERDDRGPTDEAKEQIQDDSNDDADGSATETEIQLTAPQSDNVSAMLSQIVTYNHEPLTRTSHNAALLLRHGSAAVSMNSPQHPHQEETGTGYRNGAELKPTGSERSGRSEKSCKPRVAGSPPHSNPTIQNEKKKVIVPGTTTEGLFRPLISVVAQPVARKEVQHYLIQGTGITSTAARSRKDFLALFERLGAQVDLSPHYIPRATHLIVQGTVKQRTEKFLSFVAAGKVILTHEYIEDCAELGHFVFPIPKKYFVFIPRFRHAAQEISPVAKDDDDDDNDNNVEIHDGLPFQGLNILLLTPAATHRGIAAILRAAGCSNVFASFVDVVAYVRSPQWNACSRRKKQPSPLPLDIILCSEENVTISCVDAAAAVQHAASKHTGSSAGIPSATTPGGNTSCTAIEKGSVAAANTAAVMAGAKATSEGIHTLCAERALITQCTVETPTYLTEYLYMVLTGNTEDGGTAATKVSVTYGEFCASASSDRETSCTPGAQGR